LYITLKTRKNGDIEAAAVEFRCKVDMQGNKAAASPKKLVVHNNVHFSGKVYRAEGHCSRWRRKQRCAATITEDLEAANRL
jgi:hypothetical protein